jgi:hypothetical protein
MTSFVAQVAVQLTSTSKHPSTWVPNAIQSALTDTEELVNIMYESVDEHTYYITTILTLDGKEAGDWLPSLIYDYLEEGEELIGGLTTELNDDDVQAKIIELGMS